MASNSGNGAEVICDVVAQEIDGGEARTLVAENKANEIPKVSFGASKPATHRRPKPATVWGVLDGRIVLLGPAGKGCDQFVTGWSVVLPPALGGLCRRFPVGALAGFEPATGGHNLA